MGSTRPVQQGGSMPNTSLRSATTTASKNSQSPDTAASSRASLGFRVLADGIAPAGVDSVDGPARAASKNIRGKRLAVRAAVLLATLATLATLAPSVVLAQHIYDPP